MHALSVRRPHLMVLALFAAVTLVASAPGAAHAQPGSQGDLVAVAGHGAGRVLVAPTGEDQGTFAVQITVNVHGASPQTSFTVSRAVDLQPDGNCTGPTFVPFPDAILTTSPGGAGATHLELHRGAPFIAGVSFDVRFQLLGDDGSVLQSDCLTVTVT
jgi:hypothetical protein